MNIRNPLAAVLLLTASYAPAQPLAAYNFSGTPSNPFSMTGAAAVDDIVFKCSRVIPYRACTSEELTQRERIRASGTCPKPASPACVDYLMAAGEAAPVQLLGNQSNPSTANDDFFKKCGTVPYRPCTEAEEKQKAAWEAGKDKDKQGADSGVNDNIQGPPQMVDMPEGGPQGKMLQYPSGRVEYCFDNSCTKTSGTPMTPKEAAKYLKEQYADQKQLANSINSGGGPTNASNSVSGMNVNDHDDAGGPADAPPADNRTANSNPGSTNPPPSGNSIPDSNRSAVDNGGPVASSGNNSPRGVGEDLGGDLSRLSGGPGSSSSSSGGGTVSTGGDEPIIKVNGTVAAAEAFKSGYTYTKIGAASKSSEALIKGGAATFNADSNNGRRDVDSTIGDGTQLGKIHAEQQ